MVKFKSTLILAACLAAIATSAPGQTSTDCYTSNGNLHCQTSAPITPITPMTTNFGLLRTPDFAGNFANAYEQGQRVAAERAREQRARAEALRENEDRAAAWREAEDRKMRSINAGQLIAAGHCDEARAGALNSGDLDLAAHVAALCPGGSTK